jgi:hypothetical protein
MLTFKEYLQAAIYEATARSRDDEKKNASDHPLNKKFSVDGWAMTPMVHAASQARDRWDVPDQDWVEFLRRIVKKLSEFKNTWIGDKEVEFKSNKLKVRAIMNVNFERKNIRPITVLGPAMITKPGTAVVRTEALDTAIDVD